MSMMRRRRTHPPRASLVSLSKFPRILRVQVLINSLHHLNTGTAQVTAVTHNQMLLYSITAGTNVYHKVSDMKVNKKNRVYRFGSNVERVHT